ncbi:MAG: hypothetical protein AB8B66_01870 [Rickettsiaceae bacterium]
MTTILLSLLDFIKTIASYLWLSVSSIKFYQDIFLRHKGYGMQYILTLSIISALACTILFLDHVEKFRQYLKNDILSSQVIIIDQVLKQLPTLHYNGRTISVENNQTTIVNIADNNSNNILAIDTQNTLAAQERIKTSILLHKDQMNISLFNDQGKPTNTFPIKYIDIFGFEPRILNQEEIKSSFALIFNKVPRLITYLGFPMISGMIFLNTILDKAFIILILFVFVKMINMQKKLSDCVRVVLFSSGFYTLLQFADLLPFQELNYVIWLVQTWANFLMIASIVSLSRKS